MTRSRNAGRKTLIRVLAVIRVPVLGSESEHSAELLLEPEPNTVTVESIRFRIDGGAVVVCALETGVGIATLGVDEQGWVGLEAGAQSNLQIAACRQPGFIAGHDNVCKAD